MLARLSPLLFALYLSCLILPSSLGCSSEDVMTCAEASSVLAACDSPDRAGCGDDDEAASRILTCSGSEKADLLGNGVPGDSCFWNWQCKGDSNYSCNHGNCFRENTEGNLCDRGDDADCLPELFCADDLTVPEDIDGICSATEAPVAPALYAETVRQFEELDFEANAISLVRIIIASALNELNGDDKMRRAFHAKKHACVQGDFEVLADIPSDLRVGPVFSAAQRFPTWVRFSNGTILMGADEDSIVQGLALKLMGVEGEKVLPGGNATATTQDFLMINLPATPTTNANEFVEFAQAQFDGTLALGAYMLTHPRVALRALDLTGGKDVVSVRHEDFWAGGAYRLGERAMKYSAAPCQGVSAPLGASGDDYLRADLSNALANADVCYDFFIQVQVDPIKQSIEDSSSVWSPTEAPAVHVARLTIPQGNLESEQALAAEAACDEFGFSPWHSATEYRPLGNVNRARRAAYDASQSQRGSGSEPLAP